MPTIVIDALFMYALVQPFAPFLTQRSALMAPSLKLAVIISIVTWVVLLGKVALWIVFVWLLDTFRLHYYVEEQRYLLADVPWRRKLYERYVLEGTGVWGEPFGVQLRFESRARHQEGAESMQLECSGTAINSSGIYVLLAELHGVVVVVPGETQAVEVPATQVSLKAQDGTRLELPPSSETPFVLSFQIEGQPALSDIRDSLTRPDSSQRVTLRFGRLKASRWLHPDDEAHALAEKRRVPLGPGHEAGISIEVPLAR